MWEENKLIYKYKNNNNSNNNNNKVKFLKHIIK